MYVPNAQLTHSLRQSWVLPLPASPDISVMPRPISNVPPGVVRLADAARSSCRLPLVLLQPELISDRWGGGGGNKRYSGGGRRMTGALLPRLASLLELPLFAA